MVIVIQCLDKVGLVASIAGLLQEQNLNIVSMREHVDSIQNRFFARIEISKPVDAQILESQLKAILPDDAQIIVTVSPDRQKELYTIAREACRSIINEGNYHLDSSFKNIFYEQCQDVETHGREAIWQLPYNMGLRGRMVYNLGLPRAADGVLVSGAAASIGGQFKITPSFFYDYDVNDTRRDITIVPYKVQKSIYSFQKL